MSRQEHEVILTITSVHRYQVIARTPEEAESNAEDLYNDGDMGDVLDAVVETADAYPVESEPLEEEDIEFDTDN